MANSQSRRVFLPNDLNVQMAPSRDHPSGRVVQLRAGYNEIEDDDVLDHPVVARLLPQDDEHARFAEARARAEAEHDEAVGRAHSEYHEAISKIAAEEAEHRGAAAEDWGQRREQAMASNTVFTEPHPDAATAVAQARTAQPHVFSTSTFTSKPDGMSPADRVKGGDQADAEGRTRARQRVTLASKEERKSAAEKED
jgi:hypothetical protein